MAIKNKDFVEIEYTGKMKETGEIFDTTDENTAKESGIHTEKMKYGPIIICVGEQNLIKGLDKELEGKEPGEYKTEIPPEEAFGKKDAKLIQLIPTSKFTKQQINPIPGLQLNIDGNLGIVKRTGGGRTLVDFNHPLSGKEMIYEYKINRIIEDEKEKIKALIEMMFKIEPKVTEKDGKFTAEVEQEFPEEIKNMIKEKVKELIGTDISITTTEKKENNTAKTEKTASQQENKKENNKTEEKKETSEETKKEQKEEVKEEKNKE